MRNPTLTRTFGAIAVVAAFGLGIAIFVQSVRGQDAGPPVASIPYPTVDLNATPTSTAQQTSDYSEAARATAIVEYREAATKIVESHASVAGIARDRLANDRVDPPGLDVALKAASEVVSGRVTDQSLAWSGTSNVDASLQLVSEIASSDGRILSVAQGVAPRFSPTGAFVIGYYSDDPPLEIGTDYAMLITKSSIPAVSSLVRGYAFRIEPDGTLSAVVLFDGSVQLDKQSFRTLQDRFNAAAKQ